MTPDEIQALREKHHPRTIGVADFRTIDNPERHKTIIACNICTVGENGKVLSWPCDTIKVLDAYETLLKIEAEPLIQSEVIKGKAILRSTPDKGENV